MAEASITLDLTYAPPLDWSFFVRYLGVRGTPGVERMDGERYARSVEVNGRAGTISLSPGAADGVLQLRVEGAVRRDLDEVVRRIRGIFDLDTDLKPVHQCLLRDRQFAPILTARPGIRVPGAWSPFELLVRTIVGQQVTVKAATTIMGRLADRFGKSAGSRTNALRLFPTPKAIAGGDMDGIGMPGKRVAALQTVARALAKGTMPPLEPGADLVAAKEALLALPGIGPWTVEYFALRALRDADAWPETDLVLKRAIEQYAAARVEPVATSMDHWRPYRGYAAMHLWNQASENAKRQNTDGKSGATR